METKFFSQDETNVNSKKDSKSLSYYYLYLGGMSIEEIATRNNVSCEWVRDAITCYTRVSCDMAHRHRIDAEYRDMLFELVSGKKEKIIRIQGHTYKVKVKEIKHDGK